MSNVVKYCYIKGEIMKNFFSEFKKFISRGNILDMAVGVIIGAAFSAIVTSLVNKILMPIVNLAVYACTGGNGISLITVLNGEEYMITDSTGANVINPACIYIDWGDFIQAVVNFIIVALVIFTIIRIIMKSKGFLKNMETKAMKGKLTRAQRKDCKAKGINIKDKEAVKAYLEEQAQKKADEEAKKKEQEELEKQNSTNYILKEIRDLLKENKTEEAVQVLEQTQDSQENKN